MRESRLKKLCMRSGMALAVLGLLCLGGLVVSLLLLGLKETRLSLYAILCGSFAGGAVLFGLCGLLLLRRGEFYAKAETDALERADSEESFFVGEDTLARFGEAALVISGAKGSKISIPYEEISFFSVCARTKPADGGERSVLMQFPAHYLDGKGGKDEPPVLIRTDAKERLFACLKAHGLTVTGELPQEGKVMKSYTRMQKFVLPLPEKRKHALIMTLVGAAAFCAGIGVAFWQATVGCLIAFIGGYMCMRGVIALLKAKRVLAVYEEGIFLKEPNRAESCFLKWEEIDRAHPAKEREDVLRIECPYGAYEFPCPAGAYEFLREHFPDKCKEV